MVAWGTYYVLSPSSRRLEFPSDKREEEDLSSVPCIPCFFDRLYCFIRIHVLTLCCCWCCCCCVGFFLFCLFVCCCYFCYCCSCLLNSGRNAVSPLHGPKGRIAFVLSVQFSSFFLSPGRNLPVESKINTNWNTNSIIHGKTGWEITPVPMCRTSCKW